MSQNVSDVSYEQSSSINALEFNQIDNLVGSKIRFYRKKIGFSQDVLAKQLNISAQQLQKYEKGINRVSASRLFVLSKILKIKIQDLFIEVTSLFEEEQCFGLSDTGQRLFDMENEQFEEEKMESDEAKEILKLYFKIKDPNMRQYLKAIMQGLIVEDKIKQFHE